MVAQDDVAVKARFVRFGEIEIDGEVVRHDVVIEGGRVKRRRKKASRPFRDTYGHTPLSVAEHIPWAGTTLIVGTGATGELPVMDEVRVEAERRGVRLVVLPTREACELLDAADEDSTCAVLHVTC